MRCCLACLCGLFGSSVAFCGESLVLDGAFDATKGEDPSSEYRCTAGKFTVFTEDASWNRCGKLVVPSGKADKKGETVYHALMYAGGDAEHEGFAVEPDAFYDFALELKGDVRAAYVRVFEWTEEAGRLTRRKLPLDLRVEPGREWARTSGRFRVGPSAKRAAIGIELWSSSSADTGLKKGDFILVDNIRVEKSAANERLFADGRKVAVAAVSPVEEMSVPFLPEDLIDAPSEIRLRAAVNEQKPLPLAVANLTDRLQQYRVILETVPEPDDRGRMPDNGAFGLAGFPADRITVREALRFKDSKAEKPSLRLDPLPRINEASVITVPPQEAGLVWFDFDSQGVRPGEYRGRIRVIPLGERSTYEWNAKRRAYDYEGALDVPVALTVDPIVLMREPLRPGMTPAAETREEFDLFADIGRRIMAISTWMCGTESATDPDSPVARIVRRNREWAAARGIRIEFYFGYNAFAASQKVYNPKGIPERKWEAWRKMVEVLRDTAKTAGLSDGEYLVESWDEPFAADLPDIVRAHRMAREIAPGMRFYIPFCVRDILDTDFIGEIGDLLDLWNFLDHPRFFTGKTYERFRALGAKGVRRFQYRCSTSPTLSLSSYYRRRCWVGEHYGLDGDNIYIPIDWNQTGVPGAGSFKTTTYGGLIYRSFDTFIPSVRYMAFREGETDVKYLAKLREVAGDDPEAKAFLADVTRQVVIDHPEARDLPAEMRERARELLLRKCKE